MRATLIGGLATAVLFSGCQSNPENAEAAFSICMEAGGIEVSDVHFEFDENGRMVDAAWESLDTTPAYDAQRDACMSMILKRYSRRDPPIGP